MNLLMVTQLCFFNIKFAKIIDWDKILGLGLKYYSVYFLSAAMFLWFVAIDSDVVLD